MLKKWFGTARYVYNKGVHLVRQKYRNFQDLRNNLVTGKRAGVVNPEVESWELETPKDIRAEALRDLSKGLNAMLARKQSGNIDHFEMQFRKKRDMRASIVINKRTLKIAADKMTVFGKSFNLNEVIGTRTRKKWFGKDNRLAKEWGGEFDCRMVTDGRRFWLNIPVRYCRKPRTGTGMIALDPGLRSFQTGFSDREAIVCHEHRMELVKQLRAKMDGLRQARSLKRINRCTFGRRHYKWARKLENRTDALHWETINYLTGNYGTILLPHFESQEMRITRINTRVNRDFDHFRHFRFKSRLLNKCVEREVKLYLVDESYTSKTCGCCGSIKKIEGSKVYECGNCSNRFDRDINGARNIMIKNINKKVHLVIKGK